MSVIKRSNLYEFKCPFSVIKKVRITEGFLEEMYKNFVDTCETVRIREVSVWPRGSTVGKISLKYSAERSKAV